jgi:hypothetical protein
VYALLALRHDPVLHDRRDGRLSRSARMRLLAAGGGDRDSRALGGSPASRARSRRSL